MQRVAGVGEVLTYGANECGQLGQSHINPLFAGPFSQSTAALSGRNGHAAAAFNTADHVPTFCKALHGRRVVRVSCGAHHCVALSGTRVRVRLHMRVRVAFFLVSLMASLSIGAYSCLP